MKTKTKTENKNLRSSNTPPRQRKVAPALRAATPKLSALIQIARLINSLADSPGQDGLPFAEVHAAIREGRLFLLLQRHSGRPLDFSSFESPPARAQALQAALRQASATFQGREFLKSGICRNAYCLALAIVLEAVQQQFHRITPNYAQLR